VTNDRRSWPVSTPARAILNHPDRRTSWVVALGATLEPGALVNADILAGRLKRVIDALPVVGARLDGQRWKSGGAPEPVAVGRERPDARLLAPFRLDRDPPTRILLSPGGEHLWLSAHHAALDGLGLAAVLAGLLGADPTPLSAGPHDHRDARRPAHLRETLLRLACPADPLVRSSTIPQHDSIAVSSATPTGHFTAQLVAACVAAAAARNDALGHPLRRVGISVGIGGPSGDGNTATYRRLDLSPHDDVVSEVMQAIERVAEPRELLSAPRRIRLIAPAISRLSDSLLVSNLGCISAPGAERVEFFPVARGRSAVAFGAVGVRRGQCTVSINARHLSAEDAARLLDDVVTRLAPA
jgi:hypothetical protein